MEQGLTKQRIVAELSRSPHGKLADYVEIGRKAVQQEGAFYQHLIAWDRTHGQIRDAKVALPMIGIAYEKDAELLANSFAHIASLGPRELLRAFHFARELRPAGQMLPLYRVIRAYLQEKEADRGWDHIAVQHRKVLKELYAYVHLKPSAHAKKILFLGEHPRGSVFEAIAHLKDMSPTEAAGAIMHFKIPFMVAAGALYEKAKEPDLVLALIGRMTATELVTNTKMLEKLGLKTNPALRGAFDEALKKAASSKKNTLKTTRAADAVADEGIREKLRGLQEKQIEVLGGPDGNWLVLADKSGSMSRAIEAARHVSATLAKMVSGKVYLVFFDTAPLTVDVTGLPLDSIQKATRHITANGGTSIGCGLNRMLQEKIEIDGIAVVSDGGENTPPLFPDVYKKYTAFVGKDVPVYLYLCDGEPNNLTPRMAQAGIEMQTFDIRGGVDYFSIPNLVHTMRGSMYSLVDEIMQTPLLSLGDVLKCRNGVTRSLRESDMLA